MPENDLWEVFLTPHTDDETLAMAGAITHAHFSGLKTRVILVTDNKPSIRQSRLYPLDNLDTLRRVEWQRAMEALRVNAFETWEIPEDVMAERPFDVQAMIEDRIEDLLELDILHLHTVCGADDIHIDAGYGSISHILCANAASKFAQKHPGVRVTLHGVYVYSKPVEERAICGSMRLTKIPLSKKEWMRKIEALLCYRPGQGSLGYGYRSVPELFDNALMDPHEYTVELSQSMAVSA